MTPNDYEQLGRIAYSLINGAVLLSFMTVAIGFGYAWYRLIRWAMREWWDMRPRS